MVDGYERFRVYGGRGKTHNQYEVDMDLGWPAARLGGSYVD
jgi:hypothetical protein